MNNSDISRNEDIGIMIIIALIFSAILVYGVFGLVKDEISLGSLQVNYKYVGFSAKLISIAIIQFSVFTPISIIFWFKGNDKNKALTWDSEGELSLDRRFDDELLISDKNAFVSKIAGFVSVTAVFLFSGTIILEAFGYV